ncbi:hypothetical protein [Nocardioides lijunqiniae]|uniref:hypothetical protein n=1 Tax=Nocardioides lijunqiniae TaxID=2760832 RepID=UPI001877DA41|nr:hypothetical protein [Nocardioides lijunqiniae]
MQVSIAPPAVLGAARGRLHRWSVESQQRARRNAMVAATECAQRRAEREEVDDFFAALRAPRADDAARRTAHA